MQALPITYVREMLDRAANEIEKGVMKNLEYVPQFTSSFYRNILDRELLNIDFECKELDWLFSEEFKEAFYARKETIDAKAIEQPECKEVMGEIDTIVKYLWDREETHKMGSELDSLTGSLMAYFSEEHYKQGLRDGYNLAGLTKCEAKDMARNLS